MSYPKSNYSEKLKDPRWQRKRLEILTRDGWKCRKCDSSTSTLHVHHRYYIKGREPWEYGGFCLQTLCLECHESEEPARYENGDFGGCEEWELLLWNLFSNDSCPDGIPIAAAADHAVKTSGATIEEIRAAIELMLLDEFGLSHWIEMARARTARHAARRGSPLIDQEGF